MTTYNIPTGKTGHIVTVSGVWMTGDTYNIKDIIRQYFGGKWDSNRRAWQIIPDRIDYWMGIKIKIASSTTKQQSSTYNPSNWRNADGSLGEDF